MASRPPLRVLRVYHGGRDAAHRARERALAAAGADVTLVVPARWPGAGAEAVLGPESFPIVELDVRRPGDVNRHVYAEPVERVIEAVAPDVLDVHEEPFSLAARRWLRAAPSSLPIVMYTAQNVDKRLPPPFHAYERQAHRRVAALYACSRQAASVARGKGFGGRVEVLPLGYDEQMLGPGVQSLDDDEIVLGLVGRLVPEKGVGDAVRVLGLLNAVRPARLMLVGDGPAASKARELAAALGVADRLELRPWGSADALAATYRQCHVILIPSTPTATWTEQFGRVIVEAQASGAVVAGYATGAIPDVAGNAAILAPSGDARTLGEQVLAVLGNGAELARLRAAGLALAAERTWGRIAARQLDLYVAALVPEPRTRLARSPSARRRAAEVEFGPTARLLAGSRPFALPGLRRGGPVAALLGAVLDRAAELRSRFRRSPAA